MSYRTFWNGKVQDTQCVTHTQVMDTGEGLGLGLVSVCVCLCVYVPLPPPRLRAPLSQHFFTRQCLKADGRSPSGQPLASLPWGSLHCTVRLCQPVSQVLEQLIQEPVTH